MKLSHKLIAEFIGTAALLAIVVGSGIMGENLSQGNVAIALLANSLATGAGLFVLIQCLGSISGAHFNPVVSLVEFLWRRLSFKNFVFYGVSQTIGAIIGVWIAHAMFQLPIIQVSTKSRVGMSLFFSEIVATVGLLSVIALVGKRKVENAPVTIAAYIMSAYWFTSSTSFANPAVTIARSFTNTFCGIAPNGMLPFISAQVIGGLLVFALVRSAKKL